MGYHCDNCQRQQIYKGWILDISQIALVSRMIEKAAASWDRCENGKIV